MEQWRILALRFIFLLFFFALISRLFYWQILSKDQLQARAESQQTVTAKTMGTRGAILFVDGTPIVTSKLSYVTFAEPKQIKDPDAIAKTLSPLLAISEATISAKLKQDTSWVSLASQVTSQTKKAIEEQNIFGLGFDKKEARFYPESTMAASLLGFVGKDDSGQDKGYFGLEGYYNIELSGTQGIVRQEKDVFGMPIVTAKSYETLPKRGHTLKLYLDRTIQYIVEQKLKEGVEKFGAKSGDIVVMDPQTGGILALAAYPTYDPANYAKAEGSLYRNPVVSDTYEPGSTFKSIMMASAINEGAVNPDTICPCPGPNTIGGFTIHNWDNTYRQNESMGDILKNSDNNGMVFVGSRLGNDKVLQYIQKFGIGESTHIDLQDEEVPDLRKKENWYAIDYATATFGQGVAVTPLQLVRAVGAIANGGKLMEPRMVKSIVTEDNEIAIKPKVTRQVLSEKGSKVMTDLLIYNVEHGEAARLYKPKGFLIAAKSGTAQIPIAGHYDEAAKTISSYIGFGPAQNPRFVMLVRLKEPRGGEHGATTAGPMFYDIAKELFAYWGIEPTE